MRESSHAYRRMGFWSATSVAIIGVVYGIVGLIGVVARPPGRDPLHQGPVPSHPRNIDDLSTVALVVMMAAVYAYAPPD
jgi:hypothetical protein